MEQRAAELQARLATVAGFGDLVNAMRGIAAARAQRARGLIDGANTYARTVAQAMAQVLALLPEDEAEERHRIADQPPLYLLLGAEQGFNGGYTEQLLATLPGPLPGAHPLRLLVGGAQAERMARARGLTLEGSAPLVAHAEAVLACSEHLHALLLQALARRQAPSVELIHGELVGANQFRIRQQRLLPLDLQPLRSAGRPRPLVHEDPARLLEGLSSEYVSAMLAQAVLHSHAAENLARLQAMAAAHENIAHMTDTLQADERRLRQEAITAEVVELAAGLRNL
ncbi:MAG: F0F1 ATP synthase subunit gamma [Curvibacter sp.]|nr:F0F1 ATP synthase subunit gamma [Curvibacter sp.]